ncbi:MAG: ABC transporter substrate-binding protein, partial [Halanaerobiales bacterium]|nr:ABC transporter substrate-binding protein [Halanaerobiales bacterium]
MIKKSLLVMLAVLMSLTLVVGCSQNNETNSEPTEETQEITLCETWGFEAGFQTIFMTEHHPYTQTAYYLANFYETLVNYQGGKIIPGLAESWTISADGLVYTFTLKQGIKFSDGADFNAAVVKKNLEMLPNLLGDYKAAFGLIPVLKEVRVIDEYVIAVHLTSPYYGALQDFAKPMPLGMMSPNAFNEDGTLSDKLLTHSLGTGPYMAAGQRAENMYTFVRNPHYEREKPGLDKFHVKVIPDNEAKALALRNGEIDLVFGAAKISYDGFQEFSEDSRYKAKTSAENVITRFLGFNAAKEPFNDKQVRLAVSHAID